MYSDVHPYLTKYNTISISNRGAAKAALGYLIRQGTSKGAAQATTKPEMAVAHTGAQLHMQRARAIAWGWNARKRFLNRLFSI